MLPGFTKRHGLIEQLSRRQRNTNKTHFSKTKDPTGWTYGHRIGIWMEFAINFHPRSIGPRILASPDESFHSSLRPAPTDWCLVAYSSPVYSSQYLWILFIFGAALDPSKAKTLLWGVYINFVESREMSKSLQLLILSNVGNFLLGLSGPMFSVLWMIYFPPCPSKTLRWRHNDHAGVSNHQPNGCLLNRLFGRRSKKTSKFRVTGLCAWNSPGLVNSPHKGPVTRKMFPFDDVIMNFFTVTRSS